MKKNIKENIQLNYVDKDVSFLKFENCVALIFGDKKSIVFHSLKEDRIVRVAVSDFKKILKYNRADSLSIGNQLNISFSDTGIKINGISLSIEEFKRIYIALNKMASVSFLNNVQNSQVVLEKSASCKKGTLFDKILYEVIGKNDED